MRDASNRTGGTRAMRHRIARILAAGLLAAAWSGAPAATAATPPPDAATTLAARRPEVRVVPARLRYAHAMERVAEAMIEGPVVVALRGDSIPASHLITALPHVWPHPDGFRGLFVQSGDGQTVNFRRTVNVAARVDPFVTSGASGLDWLGVRFDRDDPDGGYFATEGSCSHDRFTATGDLDEPGGSRLLAALGAWNDYDEITVDRTFLTEAGAEISGSLLGMTSGEPLPLALQLQDASGGRTDPEPFLPPAPDGDALAYWSVPLDGRRVLDAPADVFQTEVRVLNADEKEVAGTGVRIAAAKIINESRSSGLVYGSLAKNASLASDWARVPLESELAVARFLRSGDAPIVHVIMLGQNDLSAGADGAVVAEDILRFARTILDAGAAAREADPSFPPTRVLVLTHYDTRDEAVEFERMRADLVAGAGGSLGVYDLGGRLRDRFGPWSRWRNLHLLADGVHPFRYNENPNRGSAFMMRMVWEALEDVADATH